MYTEILPSTKLCASWRIDREKKEAYLIVESEKYPLQLKLETFPITSEDQNFELFKGGIKELLIKLSMCQQGSDLDKMAEDVASFLSMKEGPRTLKQWFNCKYEAVYE